KKLNLVSFFLIFSNQTFAQTWCAPGAEWHYRIYVPMYLFHQDGYLKITVANTYTLGSHVYHELKGAYNGQMAPPNSPIITNPNYYKATTYEANHVVYISRRDTLIFDTLADFNASVGDKWLKSNFYNECQTWQNSLITSVVVTDTGHVQINGVNLKRLTLNINPSAPSQTISIIEKIGCIQYFMYPYVTCTIDDWSYGNFVCYKDNNFPLYQPPGYTLPCDFTTVGLGEYNVVDSDFKVYPNPGSDKICISFPEMWNGKNMNLLVRDALGKKVKEQEFTETHEFDFGEYPAGFYQIELISGNQILGCRKWIKAE
ncbi:MAG TPA: T9SS type A sorting domain-containing protein, partial [Bacteroidia bacterium]|nr:T9SS type A sorting domain-containing protein [Bacteroidia bacterium]